MGSSARLYDQFCSVKDGESENNIPGQRQRSVISSRLGGGGGSSERDRELVRKRRGE